MLRTEEGNSKGSVMYKKIKADVRGGSRLSKIISIVLALTLILALVPNIGLAASLDENSSTSGSQSGDTSPIDASTSTEGGSTGTQVSDDTDASTSSGGDLSALSTQAAGTGGLTLLEEAFDPLNIYVAGNGSDDTGNGTRDYPFASLNKAFSEAQNGATIHLLSSLIVTQEAALTGTQLTIQVAEGVASASLVRSSAFTGSGYLLSVGLGATLNLNGVTVDGNLVNAANSAINLIGTLNLTDATIINNHSNQEGAGIYMSANTSKLTMVGGLISNNLAETADGRQQFDGAAILVNSPNGGASVTVEGNARIGANATDNGLYLKNGTVTIGTLSAGANITYEGMDNAKVGATIASKALGAPADAADLNYLNWKSIAYNVSVGAGSAYALTLGEVDFYVSSTGSDSTGAGSADMPYATILKAVRSLPIPGDTTPIPTTINIMSSTLSIDRPTQLLSKALTSTTIQKWVGLGDTEVTVARALGYNEFFFTIAPSTSLTIKDITWNGNNTGLTPLMSVEGGALTMLSGKITNNRSTASGAGVAVAGGGSFTLSGGEISGNRASAGIGHEVLIVSGSSFTVSGLVKIGTRATSAGVLLGNTSPVVMNVAGDLDPSSRIYLEAIGSTLLPAVGTLVATKTSGADVSTAEQRCFVWIPYGKKVVASESNVRQYIIADDLNLYVASWGSDTTGTGSLANPYKTMNGAIAQVPASSARTVVVMDDGVQATAASSIPAGKDISLTTWEYYDGVNAPGGTSVTRAFSGASPNGRMLTVQSGGILRVGNIVLNGNATAYPSNTDSLVYVSGGTAFLNEGGILTNNRATNGGGVYLASGALTIASGRITNNTSTSNGAGIYYAAGTLTVSGNAQIGSNGSDNGVYLATSGLLITQNGNLGSSAHINVDAKVSASAGTQIVNRTGSYTTATDDSNQYSYRTSPYVIVKHTTNAAQYVLAVANDLYVAAPGSVYAGNDGNNGSVETPFATITRALAVAAPGATRIHVMTDLSMATLGTVRNGTDITILTWSGYAENPGVDPTKATVTRGINGNLLTVQGGATLRLGNGTAASGIIFNGNKSVYTANTGSLVLGASGASLFVNTNTVLTNNRATNGGALSSSGAAVTINGATISNNTAVTHGGGIYVIDSALTVNGSTVTGNSAGNNGGGLSIQAASGTRALSLSNSEIRSNTATNGGGVYLLADGNSNSTMNANLTNLQVQNNSASASGGGVYAYAYGWFDDYEWFGTAHYINLTLSAGTISNNTTTSGAGVYLLGINDGREGTVTSNITGTALNNNTASGNGGGISLEGTAPTTLSNVAMTGNAATAGKAVYHAATSFTISGSTQIGTDTSDNGVYLTNASRVINQTGNLLPGAHIEVEYVPDAHGGSLIATRSGGTAVDQSLIYHYKSSVLSVIQNTANTAQYILSVAPDLYVAAPGSIYAGNDATGDGSAEHPLATISRALQIASRTVGSSTHIHIMTDIVETGNGTVYPGTSISISTDTTYYTGAAVGVDPTRATVSRGVNGNLITVSGPVITPAIPAGIMSISNLIMNGKQETYIANTGSLITSAGTVNLNSGTLLTNNRATNGGAVYSTGTLYARGDAQITGNTATTGKAVHFSGSFHISDNVKIGTSETDNGIYIANAHGYITQVNDLGPAAYIVVEAINDEHGNSWIVNRSGTITTADQTSLYHYQSRVFSLIMHPAPYTPRYVLYIAPDLYVAAPGSSHAGNDTTGRGTVDEPFATIGRALQVASTSFTGTPAVSSVHVMTDINETRLGTVRDTADITIRTWEDFSIKAENASGVIGGAANPAIATATRAFAGNLITVNSGGILRLSNATASGGIIFNGDRTGAQGSNTGSLIHVGGTAYLNSYGTLTNNKATNGGGVTIAAGSFTLNGGTISSNVATNGGGILLGGGTLSIQTGTITANSATNGGGVHMSVTTGYSLYQSLNASMAGGSITANSAVRGGGVYVSTDAAAGEEEDSTALATWTMTGGSISGNTASAEGGGVYLFAHARILDDWDNELATSTAAFIIGGGAITGNSATLTGSGVYLGIAEIGGEEAVADARLVVSGNALIGASAGDNGIYIADKDLNIIQNGNLGPSAHFEVSGKVGASTGTQMVTRTGGYTAATDDSSQYHYQNNRLRIIRSTMQPQFYILDADMDYFVSNPLDPTHPGSDTTGDGTVGNPYATVSKALSVASLVPGASRIHVMSDVTEPELSTITASRDITIQTWSGYSAGSGVDPTRATIKRMVNGNLYTVNTGAVLRIGSVILDGNRSVAPYTTNTGSLVLVNGNNNTTGNASLYLTGGAALTNNRAANGGAIYNSGGTLSLIGTATQGITISGNLATGKGGGLYTVSLSSTSIAYSPTVPITSATFSSNSAAQGGGIYVDSTVSYGGTVTAGGQVNLTNTTVQNNTASGSGGGIYFAATAVNTYSFTANTTVTNNMALSLQDTAVTGNTATTGGEVQIAPTSTVSYPSTLYVRAALALPPIKVSGKVLIGSSPADRGMYLGSNALRITQSGDLNPASHINIETMVNAIPGQQLVSRSGYTVADDSQLYHYQTTRYTIKKNPTVPSSYILEADINIYVAAPGSAYAGNDTTGDGTLEHPYATISRALETLSVGTAAAQVAWTINVMTDITETRLGAQRTGSNVTLKTWLGYDGTGANATADTVTRGINGDLISQQDGTTLSIGALIINGNKGTAPHTTNTGSLVALQGNSKLILGLGSILTNNRAVSGGAVRAEGTDSTGGNKNPVVALTGGIVSGNTSTGNGGGLSLQSATLQFSSGSVEGNGASGSGGGIFLTTVATLPSYSYGGTIARSSLINGGNVSGNTAGLDGGGIFLAAHITYASSDIYETSLESLNTLTMTAGSLSGNTAARNGGGILLAHGDTNSVYDGYEVWTGCITTFTFSGGSVSSNHALLGGGMYQTVSDSGYSDNEDWEWDYHSSVVISGGTITGNTLNSTSGHGTALYASTAKEVTLSGSPAVGTTEADNGIYIATADGRFNQTGNLGSEASINIEGKLSAAVNSEIAYKSLGSTTSGEAVHYVWQTPAYKVVPRGGSTQYYVLAPQTEFYVSAATGSDTAGTGTRTRPFATIAQALSYTSPDVPTTVYIMDNYSLTQPVVLSANKQVMLTADTDEDAPEDITLTRSAGNTGDLFTVAPGTSLTLSGLIIDGNAQAHPAGTGTVVRVNGGTSGALANFTLLSGTIQNNHASGNGGAVYLGGATGRVYLKGGSIIHNSSNSLGGAVFYGVGSRLEVQGAPRIGATDHDNGIYIATSTAVGGMSAAIQQQGDLLPGASINVEGKDNRAAYDFVAQKTGGTEVSPGRNVTLLESNLYHWQTDDLRLVPNLTNQYIVVPVHTIYVKSTGSDTDGIGTWFSPYQTLERAFLDATPGVYSTIFVMDDGVKVNNPAVLQAGANVTIQSYWDFTGVEPVVTAGSGLNGPMVIVNAGSSGDTVETSLVIRDIIFSGGSVTHGAPALEVMPGAILTMLDGGIRETVAAPGEAAAMSIGEGAVFTLYGGQFTHNTSAGTSIIDISDGGSFVMGAGRFSNNTVDAGAAIINIGENAAFDMSGGLISDNLGEGTGVLFTQGTMTISGSPQIHCDNAGHGVWLGENSVIDLVSDLDDLARIEVSYKDNYDDGTTIVRKATQSGTGDPLTPVTHAEARRFYWEPMDHSIVEKTAGNLYVLGDFEAEFISAVANGVADVETSTKITLTFDVNIPGLNLGSVTVTDPAGGLLTTRSLTKVGGQVGVYELSIRGKWAEGALVDVSVNVPGVALYPPTITDVVLHRSADDITPYDFVKETWDETEQVYTANKILLQGDEPISYRLTFGVPAEAHNGITSMVIRDELPVGLVPASSVLSDCVTVTIGDEEVDITEVGTPAPLAYDGSVLTYTFDLATLNLEDYLNEDVVMEITLKVDDTLQPEARPQKVKNSATVIVNHAPSTPSVETETPEQDLVYYGINSDDEVTLSIAQAAELTTDALIIAAAHAEAWKTVGISAATPVDVVITSTGGFTPVAGSYTVVFAVADKPGTTTSTTFVVLADPTYTVAYHGNGNTGGSAPLDSNEYLENATVSVATNTGGLSRTGYTLKGWATSETATDATYALNAEGTVATPSSFVMGNTDVDLYAVWELHTWDIAYSYTGTVPPGAPVKPSTEEDVAYGTSQTRAAAPTLSGYSFSGWTTSDVVVDGSGNFTMPDNNVTFTGFWTAQGDTAYKVEHYLVSASGTLTLDHTDNLSGTTGTTVNATPRSYAAYTYSASYPGTKASGTIAGDGSLVLKLYYTQNTYTVTFVDWNGAVLTERTGIPYGGAALAPASPVRAGYTFTGWDKPFNNVTSNLIVTALYTPLPPAPTYTVTFVDWDGTVLAIRTGVASGGAAVAPPSPSRTGYTFTGWDSSAYGTVTSDLTITAQYAPKTFTVTFVDGQGNTLQTSTVNYGESVTPPSDPTRTGYTFTGWNSGPSAWTKVTADATITATWSAHSTPTTPGGIVPETPRTTTDIFGEPLVIVTQEELDQAATEQGIPSIGVPLAAPAGFAAWALANLILVVLSIVATLAFTLARSLQNRKSKKAEEQSSEYYSEHSSALSENARAGNAADAQERRSRGIGWLVAGILVTLLGLVLFILTQDMSLPMVWTDRWTIVNLVILLGAIALGVIAIRRTKQKRAQQESPESGHTNNNTAGETV